MFAAGPKTAAATKHLHSVNLEIFFIVASRQ
jgi:hypothetical protein